MIKFQTDGLRPWCVFGVFAVLTAGFVLSVWGLKYFEWPRDRGAVAAVSGNRIVIPVELEITVPPAESRAKETAKDDKEVKKGKDEEKGDKAEDRPTPPAPPTLPSGRGGPHQETVELRPETWSEWKATPPGSQYRIDWSPREVELEIEFLDQTKTKKKGGDYTDVGVRRGIFKFRASQAVVVTITATF